MAFQPQQGALEVNAAREAAQLPRVRHHAMAGHDDRDRIATERAADRAAGRRSANAPGDVAVAGHAAECDPPCGAQYPQRERRDPRQIERNWPQRRRKLLTQLTSRRP